MELVCLQLHLSLKRLEFPLLSDQLLHLVCQHPLLSQQQEWLAVVDVRTLSVYARLMFADVEYDLLHRRLLLFDRKALHPVFDNSVVKAHCQILIH